MATLADWLRANDISDAEFGRRIGCDRGSVGRYTRGERYPDPPTLLRIGQETHGEVTADDMLATWLAANPAKAPQGDGQAHRVGQDASAAVLAAPATGEG